MRSDIEAGRAYVLLAIKDKLTAGLNAAERRLRTFGKIASRGMRNIGSGLSDGLRSATSQLLHLNRSAEKSAARIAKTASIPMRQSRTSNVGPSGGSPSSSGADGLVASSLAVRAALTGAAGASMLWPLKLSADMEQAATSFEVFLGSADAAKKMIGNIETMAAKTPFQFDELKDSAQMLMGFGATGEQVLPMMQMLGDVSGGNSERFQRLSLAFGQVMAKGRLMGQEVMQMTEQGFNPLMELSKLTGKSMKTLMGEMEQGAISFPMLVQAFRSATGPGGRFNGLMEKQSSTLTGLVSTFLDYSKIAARALGDALLPTIKAVLTPAISLAQGFAAIVKANAGLVAGIGKLVLIAGAIASVFVGVGVAAMAASYVVGLLASGFAATFLVIGTIFSPLGVLIGVLAGLAGAAFYFRGAIYEAFQGLLVWVQPVTDAFWRILAAGQGAVQGIVDALSNGNIQLAGTIAIAALKAMFWQAASEIPGSATVLATSYGQAILAGRWDLAAAIALTKVKLVLLQGWNGIANIWTAAITGLGALWEMVVQSITTTWRSAVYSIASGILWVMEQLGMATDGVQGQLEAMRQSDQAESDAAYQKSMAARSQAEHKAYADRKAQEQALQSQLAALQEQAFSAAKDAGVTTAADAAAKARAELDAALKAATDEKEKAAKGMLPGNLVPGLSATPGTPKVSSQGTFSAAAAMTFGARSSAVEETARNTRVANTHLRTIANKPTPAFGP